MKKELVSRIVSGLLGGIVICYLITIGISISLGNGNFYPCVPSLIKQFGNEITAVIVQTILSALLGAGFAASSLIWEKDDWSLLKQTSVYFAIVTVLMMTVACVLCYFAIFFAIFIIVWVIQFIIWKRRISKINSKITYKN